MLETKSIGSVSLPNIHPNGTPATRLRDQNEEALRALKLAMEALTEAAPNARDYYVQPGAAFEQARSEHVARLMALQLVHRELEQIMYHAHEAVEAKERRRRERDAVR